jgi:hypothetical protein
MKISKTEKMFFSWATDYETHIWLMDSNMKTLSKSDFSITILQKTEKNSKKNSILLS